MEGAPQTQTKSSEQIKNGNQVSVMSTGTKEEKNTEIAVQPDSVSYTHLTLPTTSLV